MTVRVTTNGVRDRLMTLCAQIELPAPLTPITSERVYRDESGCSFKAADLPAFVVKAGGRGNQYEYADSSIVYFTQREFRIGLYIAHMTDESYARDMDQVDLTELATQSVVDFFAARKTLMNDAGNNLVESARIIDSTIPHTMATKGSNTKNRGIQFRMVVRFSNFAKTK
jgi:hypothetical protein